MDESLDQLSVSGFTLIAAFGTYSWVVLCHELLVTFLCCVRLSFVESVSSCHVGDEVYMVGAGSEQVSLI